MLVLYPHEHPIAVYYNGLVLINNTNSNSEVLPVLNTDKNVSFLFQHFLDFITKEYVEGKDLDSMRCG